MARTRQCVFDTTATRVESSSPGVRVWEWTTGEWLWRWHQGRLGSNVFYYPPGEDCWQPAFYTRDINHAVAYSYGADWGRAYGQAEARRARASARPSVRASLRRRPAPGR
jgi:hypothetical protein